jgi:hypothetical protein
MTPQMLAMLKWVGIYTAIILGIIILINWYSQGFLMKYAKVKGSRGKKIMMRVDTVTDTYLNVGKSVENFLIFKARGSKEVSRLEIPKDCTYRHLGINWIDYDEKTNKFVKIDHTTVIVQDGERTQNLYVRALYKPTILNKKDMLILILLVVALLGIIVLIFMVQKVGKNVLALGHI